MVENDFVVAESIAEAGQIETVIVSVTGSHEDNALRGPVSNQRAEHMARSLVDAQMAGTYF
jgi:hypothetical protein